MQQAHKIRLNPTPTQELYFRKACGTARYCFNWGLAEVKQALSEGRRPAHWMELKARFNAIKGGQFAWVYDLTKCAVETGFKRLGMALSSFWASKQGRRKGKRIGFPSFKSKKRGYGSFGLANDKFSVKGQNVILPKLGPVAMTEQLRFQGKVMGATISYYAGWWWISIQVDVSISPTPRRRHSIGVDLGIKQLAVTSDGQVVENQHHLKQAPHKLHRLQRQLSRKVRGSKNRAKALQKLQRLHYRVTCLRKDSIHKFTAKVARRATLIGLEDLHIAGMLRNHRLAQALSDASLGEFQRQLAYKAARYGGRVVLVDRFFPSSQIHDQGRCGYRYRTLSLAERMWRCPHCNKLVDRDLNAARNICREAKRLQTFGPGLAPGCLPVDEVLDGLRPAISDEAGNK